MENKSDSELGNQIHQYLREKGVETPTIYQTLSMSPESKEKKLIELFTSMWETLGLDLSDDSLRDTPKRMAKMYVREIYQGLCYENFPKCTTVQNKMNYNEMVISKNITVMSNCEHHGVTIAGKACVGYIPKDNVLGLSKINRIVDFFSKRPQIQERLTEQIYHAMCYILDTESIAVVIDAEHYCVKARGIRDVTASTVTSRIGGIFLEHSSVRSEFMSLALKNSP